LCRRTRQVIANVFSYVQRRQGKLIYKERLPWQLPPVLAPIYHHLQEVFPIPSQHGFERHKSQKVTHLIVQKLFSSLSGIFGIRRLNNGINWATLLTKTTVNALCHVDVVSGCSSASILTLFGFDRNGLGGANLKV
jgi:hypothetical protein